MISKITKKIIKEDRMRLADVIGEVNDKCNDIDVNKDLVEIIEDYFEIKIVDDIKFDSKKTYIESDQFEIVAKSPVFFDYIFEKFYMTITSLNEIENGVLNFEIKVMWDFPRGEGSFDLTKENDIYLKLTLESDEFQIK